MMFSAEGMDKAGLPESPPAWEPQDYESWVYQSSAEKPEPYSADPYASQPGRADSEQQGNEEPTTASQQQQWHSYYPSSEDAYNSQQHQDTGTTQGQSGFAPPPLPLAPPPQPPPPPDISSTTSWSSVVQVTGGTETTMDSAGYAASSYYGQEQPMHDGSYPSRDGETNSNPGTAVSGANTPSANGSHNYGQTYPGYGTEPYAYGGPGYQNYGYGYLQQGNDSYSQNMGAYQNSGSFQNTTSNTDTASYQNPGTYYNAGVYQNTGAYQGTGYSGAQNTWSDGSYGSYGGYTGYSGYSAQEASVPQTQAQYQQDYQAQWAEYYATYHSTETSGAPGTDAAVSNGTVTATVAPTYASIVAHGASGNVSVPSQPPPPGTLPSWSISLQSYGETAPAQVDALQAGATTITNSWDASGLTDQQITGQQNQMEQASLLQQQTPSQQAQSLGTYTMPHSMQYQQAQQQHHQTSHYQQAQHPVGAHLQQGRYKQSQQQKQSHVTQHHKLSTQQDFQVSQVYHVQNQESVSSEPGQWRTGKVQIPTNPRIPQSLGIGMSAAHKTSLGDGSRPAYISVGGQAGGTKLSSDDVADATLQPGMFPPSLRAYVERALSRCRDDAQKAACQDIMKEMITVASRDGSLFTKDWDTEPLFPLPEVHPGSKGNLQHPSVSQVMMKLERSPARRVKSRWEPVPEEEDEKHGRAQITDAKKENSHDQTSGQGASGVGSGVGLAAMSPSNYERREMPWMKAKFSQQQTPTQPGKRTKKGLKRLRRTVALNHNGAANSESESEEEEDTGGIHLGSMVSAETPEEKRRRQSRTKRFDKSKELSTAVRSTAKAKGVSGGTASARRATALQLAMSAGDGNGRAVEDIDWDSLTVRGTCQEIEKRYLRLTSAPDPGTVRPEEVLKKALAMVQSTPKTYLFKCEQLKSIRQDLTVQRIRDELTVQVYETHARMALEAGDLPEYNQCQTQLKGLYAEGIKGCSNEFAAYGLLYIVFQQGSNRDLLSSMARLSPDAKKDEAVLHALAVREAVAIGNYHSFFRLYRTAPNLNPYLMDLHVEKMRFEALRCMSRAYRPALSIIFIARALGFMSTSSADAEDKDGEGTEECEEWLRAHGAQIMAEGSSGELVMDAKASSTALFMPEPEDVVPHGDANLALNDFFART